MKKLFAMAAIAVMCLTGCTGNKVAEDLDFEKATPEAVVSALAEKKGVVLSGGDASGHRDFKEKEYDRLAAILRENLDMDRIYSMLREAAF